MNILLIIGAAILSLIIIIGYVCWFLAGEEAQGCADAIHKVRMELERFPKLPANKMIQPEG